MIIKKDGSLQNFDETKIINAIEKSAKRCCVNLNENEKKEVIKRVKDDIDRIGKNVNVSEVHNMVECALECVNGLVAKSYKEYRNYKKDFSAILDKVWNKKLSLKNADDRSNANADSSLVTTQKAIVYNEMNSLLYDKFFLNDEERKASEEGYIYIHDKGSRLDTTNCFERSTRFITSNGVKSFYDFTEGDEVEVISHKGIWRKARVVKLPWHKIQRVWFKRGAGDETYVDCTPNHRWILKDGTVTTTLKVGDMLTRTPDITMKGFDSLSLDYGLYSNSGRNNWFVSRIEEIKLNSKANVWCLDVEEDHSFLLEKGIPTGNCSLFDMESVLKGGFVMGNIEYTEPKSLDVAFGVIADVMLNAGSFQYGGLTVCEFDKLIAPYAEKSYQKYLKEYKEIKESDGEQVDDKKADKYAYNKVKRDMEQGVQQLECRFNSVNSARGDYPFTSITFGLGTGRWETLFSSTCMKVRKEGQGGKVKVPVLFPKLSFFYDEELHGEGKPLEWLFDEAIDCSSKSMYPDFISLVSGYQGEIYKKYKKPISRMGCVCGNENVIYKDEKGNIHECLISEMWNYLSKLFDIKSQKDLGFSSGSYLDLKGIYILDKSGFVNCSRIIFNTENPLWYCVKFSCGKSLICTADHPWTVKFGDLFHVTQTKDLIVGDIVEIFDNKPKYTEENNVIVESIITHYDEIDSIEKLDFTGVSYDVTTESEHFYCSGVRSHNCRAQLSPWFIKGGITPADDNDEPVYVGRINLGAIALHFPMIVAKAKEENKDFFEVLEYYMDIVRGIHKKTFEYLSHKKAGINPLGFCQGGFLNGHLDPDQEISDAFLRPMTISFGVIALNEASVLQTGKKISEDNSFAIEVMKWMNDYIAKYKKIDGILYALYGVPGESLVIKQVEQFRKKYGIVKDVSDHEYTTNSFHCCVRDDITPIEKQDIEYPMYHLCNGGNIQYCRYPLQYNFDAIKTLVKRAMKLGFYEGVNIQLDFCPNCGTRFNDRDTCPNCGSKDIVRIERMNGYLGLSKIRGKSFFSDGKMTEFEERVSM
jgi:anaerobic ribonucleoside-triphosphate reductase